MDKIKVWARSDLIEETWQKNEFDELTYMFHNGINKTNLESFTEPTEPYSVLRCNNFAGKKVFQPVYTKKQIKNSKYFYPIFCIPYPTECTWKDIAFIEPLHLRNIKDNFCKILIINTMEGWNHQTYFKDVIDIYREKYDLNYENFVILSGNMDAPEYPTPSVYYNWWEQHMAHLRDHNDYDFTTFQHLQPDMKKREHKFICLNRRPHVHRLMLASLLQSSKNQGILTCCKDTDNGDMQYYERSIELAQEHYPDILKRCGPKFFKQLPMVYDDGINAADDNPTIDNKPDKFFNSWLHIVTETYGINGQTFFSEKIFKPMIYWQPFILVGAQHDLKNLRSLGYKTFDGIIDESYDTVENNQERLLITVKEIRRIISMNDKQLEKLYLDCHEILTHNHFHWYYRQFNIHNILHKDLWRVLHD